NATAAMHPRLTLSYRTAIAPQETLVAAAGQRVTGHEFHRTQVSPASLDGSSAWLLDGLPAGFSADPAGTGSPTLHASYLHTHWAGYPAMAQRLADAVHAYQPTSKPMRHGFGNNRAPVSLQEPPQVELGHHGDVELGDGLANFAVNVLRSEPPQWLAEVINAATPTLAAYPDAAAAIDALARLHGRDRDEVLPTAGAAEGFVLLARSLKMNRAVVVHPQFTEPELALRAAGHDVTRVVLTAGDGFRFDRTEVPDDADAIFIGNPTNPTSVLHRSSDIVRLLRPGRTVVVDEAFMDVVPGEIESLVRRRLPGLVVLRSLTKTWGIAGLRAGYAVGDRQIIAGMSANQPRWSVSSAALAVMRATATRDAEQERHDLARSVERNRTVLLGELAAAGIRCVSPARGPFVLADTSSIRPHSADPGWLRQQLRDCGYAVRRGDTFPGLGADWIRIAVRSPEQTRALISQVVTLVAAKAQISGRIR
ncbi:MAG: Rv2231c family pyridoxal phosphate-dependent protein CobC, partial [Antricoccus sp.]